MRNRFVYPISLVMLTLSTGCSSTDEARDSGSVQSRGLQQPMQPGMAMKKGMPVQSGASGPANIQLPTWPQKFEVQGPEVQSFGFPVTQPGPITVEVQAQGAPLLVTLQSSGGQPITQPATGGMRMSYNATPQDVQRSLFWTVQIRLAQPMPPQQGGRAGGTINVQHPQVNHQQVQTALVAHQQAVQQQRAQQEAQAQQEAAQAAAQIEQAVQQRRALFEQQEVARRAALYAQIEPQLSRLRSQAGGAVRSRGLEGEDSSASSTTEDAMPTEATDEIGTRGGLRAQAERKIFQLPQYSSSQQASIAAGSAPPPQQVMPNPIISSLSLSQGRPGDPLFINGSNFGTGGGEVRFVMGPGMDLPAPAGVVWTNNQIVATIPDPPGLLGFSGTIYIKRAGDTITSNLAPFRFDPILVTRDYKMPTVAPDVMYEHQPHLPNYTQHWVFMDNGNVFQGLSGTVKYFDNTVLRNGWVLDEVYYSKSSLSCLGGCNFLVEKWIGNSKPYFKIRYELRAADFGSSKFTSYLIDRITLRGPKGVPDGLACMQAPCP
jgi:hypothetical protein